MSEWKEICRVDDIGAQLDKYVQAQTGLEEDRYAYKFDIKLPLRQPMELKK